MLNNQKFNDGSTTTNSIVSNRERRECKLQKKKIVIQSKSNKLSDAKIMSRPDESGYY